MNAIRSCHLRLTGTSLLPAEYNGYDVRCIPQYVANSRCSQNTQDYDDDTKARLHEAAKQAEIDRYLYEHN